MNADIDIIKDCLKGDQLACKQLYENYIAYCYGICNRYSIDRADLKDVVQIIFSQVFQSLKNYDHEKSKFKTWFTRVCINNLLSYKKKQAHKLKTQYVEDFHESVNPYVENHMDEHIDQAYILSLIQQMPSNYQTVFNLFIVDGYSHEEISQQLNISVASSRVILNRARKWVKKALVGYLNS